MAQLGRIKKSRPRDIIHIRTVKQPSLATRVDFFVTEAEVSQGPILHHGQGASHKKRFLLKGLLVVFTIFFERLVRRGNTGYQGGGFADDFSDVRNRTHDLKATRPFQRGEFDGNLN